MVQAELAFLMVFSPNSLHRATEETYEVDGDAYDC